MSKYQKLKKLVIWIVILLMLLISPLIVAKIILSPARVAEIISNYSERYINGKVEFANIRVNFADNFPFATISLDNGRVLSYSLNRECDSLVEHADTLLEFDRVHVVLNPYLLIEDSTMITLRYIDAEDLKFNGVVAHDGRKNWNVLRISSKPARKITFSRFDVRGGLDLSYFDYRTSNRYSLSLADMSFEGNITDVEGQFRVDDILANRIETEGFLKEQDVKFSSRLSQVAIERVKSEGFMVDFRAINTISKSDVVISDKLPMELIGMLKLDSLSSGKVGFDNLAFKVSDMAALFNGEVEVKGDSILSDVVCTINPFIVSAVKKLIPKDLLPAVKDISTNIEIDLRAKVKGCYKPSLTSIPNIDLDVKIDNGFLVSKKRHMTIDTVRCDLTLSYSNIDSNLSCDIRAMRLKGHGIDMDVKAHIDDILIDPFVNGKFKINIDWAKLPKLNPKSKAKFSGEFDANLNINCRKSWFNLRDIGRATIVGYVDVNNYIIESIIDSTDLMIDGRVDLEVDENDSDTLFGAKDRVVNMLVTIDSLKLVYTDLEMLAISNLKWSGRTLPALFVGKKTQTVPIAGVLTADLFRISDTDPITLEFDDLDCNYTILPSAKQKAAPHIITDFRCEEMSLRGAINRYVFNKVDADINTEKLTKEGMLASRRVEILDSLQKASVEFSRDKLFKQMLEIEKLESVNNSDEFREMDYNLNIDYAATNLLVKWNTSGSFKAKNASIITPYFPKDNIIEDLDVAFTQDKFAVKNSDITVGRTKINLVADISNVVQALVNSSTLKIKSSIKADSIDFNELNGIIATGLDFVNSSKVHKDSVSIMSNNDMVELIKENDTANRDHEQLLTIVPANIDLSIYLNTGRSIYKTLIIDSMKGSFISKDRCLQIKDLTAETNIGGIDFSAIYSTKSKKDIRTGFDIVMKDIEVDELIRLIPNVDSLLPMLKSFEGEVDCKMAATASLDTVMNVILPTLKAACSIKGRNMVLLDGETFSKVAKALRFKSRNRNLIDKISVELLVVDNKIEVFPFLMYVDRYKTAISGVHNLDLTYKYHISLLRSPLPIIIGVNVTGDQNKFTYRYSKAQFRNTNIPSYSNMIDTVRINLREKIINIFKKTDNYATVEDLTISSKIDTVVNLDDEEPMTKADSIAIENITKYDLP